MEKKARTVWGIHAGRYSEADELFLKGNCVAIGWAEVGNLIQFGADREALKSKLARVYPNTKPGAVPVEAGQLLRFVYQMKKGDIIVYPSRRDRHVHIGRIEGDYRHSPSKNQHYPNIRAVKWSRAVPRTHFSQGALYEIGSALAFFQVKTYADEFRSALEGKTAPKQATQDDTVAAVARDIEETTRDFILKRLGQELKGHALADFVAHLLESMGYRTRVSPEGVDGGVDIVAHKDELGFEPPIVKVQVKSTDGSIGDPVVSALYGKVSSSEFGLVVTLGSFTNQAVSFARSKSNLRLIDGGTLVTLILEHYDQFESRYKGLLPLKRIYVPEPIEE